MIRNLQLLAADSVSLVRAPIMQAFGALPEVARRIGPQWESLLERERDEYVRRNLAQVIASLKTAAS